MPRRLVQQVLGILWIGAVAVCLAASAQDVVYPEGGEGGTTIPPPPGGEGHILTPEELARLHKQRVLELAGAGAARAMQFTVRRLVLRMGRQTVRSAGVLRRRALRHAGPWFENVEIEADSAYGGMRLTDVDASGCSTEQDLTLSADIGDRFHGGLTLTGARTYIQGEFGSETTTRGADVYLTRELSETFSAGVFGTASAVDVEDVNGNGAAYGGGVTLTAAKRLFETDLTVTGSLARIFQDVTRREYDTVASCVFDVSRSWTDRLATSCYAYATDSLEKHHEGDRTFWVVGLDVDFRPADRFGITIGCEKIFALNDVREFRLHAALTWAW